MEPKSQDIEEQGLIKSTFQETLQAVDDRIKLIRGLHFNLESELLKTSDPLKTISDIIPSLAVYYFSESPVQPSLRDLYTSQQLYSQYRYQPTQYRCVLPPHSEGEESVNEQQSAQPSFKWISRSIIDSTLLNLDQVQAKKSERGKAPQDWGACTQLLIYNISKKIHSKSDVKSIQKYLRNNLSKWGSLKMEKMREIYYKGKCSVLLKFSDESNCSLAYYYLLKHEQSRKEHLGQDCDVYRVVSNRIKNIQQQKWVAILFRRLPINLTKETLLDILRKRNISPVWMEELIQIDNFKYTLCKVSFLDDAFELCSRFQINSPLKEVKVNLHPKSCKAWKRDHEEFLT